MCEHQHPPSDWAHLSTELWNTIFVLVSKTSARLQNKSLFRLPLVCKRFHATFLQHPHLCDHITLDTVASSKLPSMILWIQRYGQHVTQCSQYASQHFGQNCLVLAALLAHSAPLHMLELVTTPEAPDLIAAFSRLKTCKLKSGYAPSGLDLQPLQSLQHLQRLDLEIGVFRNLQAAAVHLTTLCLRACKAHCAADCPCITSLLQLQLEEATLTDFHKMGLAACCCLQLLHCDESDLIAVSDNESLYLRCDNPTMPASLTALVCLTSLQFSFFSSSSEFTFDWLTRFTALQSVEALVRCDQVVLPSSCSALSNIRRLFLEAQIPDEGFFLKLMFDWKCLINLEKLSLGGNIVACAEYRLSDMMNLTKLRHVAIWACDRSDQLTRRQLAELSYKLGKTRPDVVYIVEHEVLA